MTTLGGDEPISIIETDDPKYLAKVICHAAAEGLGVQIYNVTVRCEGTGDMCMRWVVELYDGTPTILRGAS